MKTNSTIVYKYELSETIVLRAIEKALSPGKSFLGNTDFGGRFNDNNNFVVYSGNAIGSKGVGYSSILYAEISRVNDGVTEVKTRTRAGLGVYILFGFSVVAGLAYLYQFILTQSTQMLLCSLVILIAGPALSIFIAEVSSAGTRDRYMLYIDKELRKLTIQK